MFFACPFDVGDRGCDRTVIHYSMGNNSPPLDSIGYDSISFIAVSLDGDTIDHVKSIIGKDEYSFNHWTDVVDTNFIGLETRLSIGVFYDGKWYFGECCEFEIMPERTTEIYIDAAPGLENPKYDQRGESEISFPQSFLELPGLDNPWGKISNKDSCFI